MKTKKQYIKAKVIELARGINEDLVPEGTSVSKAEVLASFPKVSYYKNTEGVIRVGLSLRGIKLLVKKFPYITKEEVKTVFNING